MKKVIIEQSGQESIVLNVPEGASVRIDNGLLPTSNNHSITAPLLNNQPFSI